jgi:hypothetical protein
MQLEQRSAEANRQVPRQMLWAYDAIAAIMRNESSCEM